MGVIVGLIAGAGAFCIWWSCWAPGPVKPVRHRPTWRERARDTLIHAGAPSVSPGALAVSCVVLGLLVATTVTAVSGAAAIGIAFGVIAGAAPVAIVASRARRRRAKLRELWPEVVDHRGWAIRAGLALPEALAQLGERGPVALRAEFREFGEDYRATGQFAHSLDRLKDRLADPVADRIIEALRITREVGGSDLGKLLRTLSGFLREEARTRGELEARQSWTVSAARLAVAAPWLVLGMLATRPEAAAAYDSPGGILVLTAGGAASVFAYQSMIRIGRLPQETRVLR